MKPGRSPVIHSQFGSQDEDCEVFHVCPSRVYIDAGNRNSHSKILLAGFFFIGL